MDKKLSNLKLCKYTGWDDKSYYATVEVTYTPRRIYITGANEQELKNKIETLNEKLEQTIEAFFAAETELTYEDVKETENTYWRD